MKNLKKVSRIVVLAVLMGGCSGGPRSNGALETVDVMLGLVGAVIAVVFVTWIYGVGRELDPR